MESLPFVVGLIVVTVLVALTLPELRFRRAFGVWPKSPTAERTAGEKIKESREKLSSLTAQIRKIAETAEGEDFRWLDDLAQTVAETRKASWELLEKQKLANFYNNRRNHV